jgi:nucleotide-binding universal stress UspA family protein
VRIVDRPAAVGLEEVAREEDAVMIVVGRRGRPGAMAGVMGSVPRRLAQHAPCAVLIVPEVTTSPSDPGPPAVTAADGDA